MAEAEPVIRAALPDANVPTSIRSSGLPVMHGSTSELDDDPRRLARRAPRRHRVRHRRPGTVEATARVRSLTPELSKGLEFDLVVLIDPDDLRHRHRGRRRPVRRDDPRDPAAGGPDQSLTRRTGLFLRRTR